MKTRMVVIGAGHWGKNIIREVDELGCLYGISDPDIEARVAIETDITTVSDYILYSHHDATMIATPPNTHYKIAKSELERGKHVFIEKPMCMNSKEAKELNSLAIDKGLTLMVGHLLLFHPLFEKLLDNLSEVGKIKYIKSERCGNGLVRKDESVLWSLAPHDFSMIDKVLSSHLLNPYLITAENVNTLKYSKDSRISSMNVDLRCRDININSYFSWESPVKRQTLTVVGDKGVLHFDDSNPKESTLTLDLMVDGGKPLKREFTTIMDAAGVPLKKEVESFVDLITKDNFKGVRNDGSSGINVIRILEEVDKKIFKANLDETFDLPIGPHYPKKLAAALADYKMDGFIQIKNKKYFSHETVEIADDAEIGEGTKIWNNSAVLSGCKIGKNCVIGRNVIIGPDVTIGDNCKIQNNVSVYKGVTLQDDVFCGPSMVFTNVKNPRATINKMDEALETIVQKGATLGAGCVIVCGNTIGKNSFVGSGSVVTKEVLEFELVYGNPAKSYGYICPCGEKMEYKKDLSFVNTVTGMINYVFRCYKCGQKCITPKYQKLKGGK